MNAYILELKGDHTGSINVLNEIMKGNYCLVITIAIDSMYGKSNPIYNESSKKKGEAILRLSHSVHKPTGYSDLSTNSRSSVNNILTKKRKLTPSVTSSFDYNLKKQMTDSFRNSSTRRSKKNSNFERLNKHATLLIERSINKSRYQMTPNRVISFENQLDLTEAKLPRPRYKIK